MPRDFFQRPPRRPARAALLDPVARELGHRRDSATCRGSARGWSTAGFSFVQLLPINEMADGQNSPYSAMSAMAIDPIFISPAAVPDIGALGGEASAAAGRARRAGDGARVADDRLRAPSDASRCSRSAGRLRSLPRARVEAGHEPRAAAEGVHRPRALVARRLRALPRAARAGRRDATGGSGPRRCAIAIPAALRGARGGARDRDPVLRVPAVARRRPVARRRARRATSACSATSRSWSAATAPTSGRASTTSVSTRRSARRRTRSRRRARTGASRRIAGTSSRPAATSGSRARARRSAELYDGYRVDHLVGFFRTYVRETSGDAAFVPPDEPEQARAGRGGARRAQRDRRAHHRRGSRRHPRVRARDARRGSRFPATRCCAGSGSGTARDSRSRIPRDYPACSVATSGTHDTEPHGGMVGRGADRRAPGARCRRSRRRRRIPIPRRRSTTRRATRSCSSSTPPAMF